MNTPKPVTLILRGESHTDRLSILAFSMLDPSAWWCRFQTADGQVMEAHGLLVDSQPTGLLDTLPPCPRPAIVDAFILDA